MFLLKSQIRNLNLPIDCQLKHFDHTVLPILLYRCEIWGFENDAITGIENVHTRFLQSIFGVKRSTPIYMVHGKLGRFPLITYVKSRMISYWCNMVITQISCLLEYIKHYYLIILIESVNINGLIYMKLFLMKQDLVMYGYHKIMLIVVILVKLP